MRRYGLGDDWFVAVFLRLFTRLGVPCRLTLFFFVTFNTLSIMPDFSLSAGLVGAVVTFLALRLFEVLRDKRKSHGDEIKENTRAIQELGRTLVRFEVEVDHLNQNLSKLVERIVRAEDVAQAAHRRLDKAAIAER
jgi:hypothetical protein